MNEWHEHELIQGQRARDAIERGDARSAGRAWKARQDAKARTKGYLAGDGVAGFNAEVILDAATVREVAELGLSPEQGRELRTALALDGALDLKSDDGVLAVLLGAPLPQWPRFWTERHQWLTGRFRPDMWPTVLLDSEPDLSWEPVGLVSLSFDARQVLAYPKLVRNERAVTQRYLAERTLLPFNRLDHALSELVSAGFASAPTIADRLATLTVTQLQQAHVDLGLAAKGAKPVLVAALASLDEDQVHAYLADHHPEALQTELNVGIGARKSADWLVAYAALMAHWFMTGLLPTARKVRDGGTDGWEIYKTGDCPVCQKAPSLVPRKRPDELPPFHIGCRCDC